MDTLKGKIDKKALLAMVVLFCAAFIAYWQVISFTNCLKWDMVDQYFPWRYHVVSCLRNGELPLWNPYNFAGYPIHADPQSGAWYLPVWLMALFGNYTAHSNAVEVFFHLWLAGVGMYALVNYLYKMPYIALIAGVSYIGCGLLVGNAQHFTYIISACWLPFVLLCLIKSVEEKGIKNPLKLALFLWLFFTGGYPAFFIITAYILGIASMFYFVKSIKNKTGVKAIIVNGGVAIGMFVLLSAPSLVSFALYWGDTTRGNLVLGDALFGPFRVGDCKSFFIPFLSAVKQENTGTDVSMVNGYFGLLPLIGLGFIVPFYRQLTKREVFIICAAVLCLLAAFGDTFFIPVRQWLFRLPGLNLFRFPAVFRLFAIVGFILMGAWGLVKFDGRVANDEDKRQKFLVNGWVAAIALVIVALSLKNIAWSTIGADFNTFQFIWTEFPTASAAALLGGVIQLVFLGLVIVFRKNLKALAFIAAANCIVMVQLNIKTTIINKENPQVIDDFLAACPQAYRYSSDLMREYTRYEAPAPLWRNLDIFYKQPSFDGNNPFRLKNFADAESSGAIKGFTNKEMVETSHSSLTILDGSSNKLEVLIRGTQRDTFTIYHNMAKYWKIRLKVPTDSTPSIPLNFYPALFPPDIKYGIVTNIPIPEEHIKDDYIYAVECRYRPPYVFEFLIVSFVFFLITCIGINFEKEPYKHRKQ